MSSNKVEIVSYDPSWSMAFEKESDKIRASLGSNCLTIHHIGSTSVPGLDAKPIIDMIPVVKDILLLDKEGTLEELGYIARGECGLPFRRFFVKRDPRDETRRLCHLHIYQEGNPEIEHHLAYRNYLISEPEVARRYAELKKILALKYPTDMTAYAKEKSKFVTEMGENVPFEGILLRNCYTEYEWDKFKGIFNIEGDFKEKEDEIYFVLYKGMCQIIGAAHLDGTLQIVKLKVENHCTYEEEFRKVLSLWLQHKRLRM